MKETRFKYKGVEVIVQDDHPNGTIIVGKRKFNVFHHHAGGLAMWMCDEAYFATPDINELARHFVDYGYMFDAPGRIVVPGGHVDPHEGDAPSPPAKKVITRKSTRED